MKNKILKYEGYSYKIGMHGYVYVFTNDEWMKTTTLDVRGFNREVTKQENL